MERIYCLVIGYVFGLVRLRRSLPGRAWAEAPDRSGSCNPGTANITRQMGKAWGLLVLAGDLLKTAAACWLCAALFPELGRLVYLWAGLGATLGHNFPVWAGFRGGKGVATTLRVFVFVFPALVRILHRVGRCCGAGHGIFAGGRRGDHHGGAAAGLALRGAGRICAGIGGRCADDPAPSPRYCAGAAG